MTKLIEIPGQGDPVEFPDSMSDEDISKAIKKNFPLLKPTSLTYSREDLQRSVAQGLKDPFTGAAQLATHVLPSGVVQAGNRANNWLAEQGVPLAKIPPGGMDEAVSQDESQYQAGRASGGPDIGRVLGNIGSPANLGVARLAGGAATVAGRLGAGAAQGAALGAATPTVGDDYWKQKAGQVATGAAAGATMAGAGEGISKLINPNLRPEVQTLLNEGVKLTPGQIAGGAANRFEQGATSIPFLGDVIKGARRKGIESFNRAAVNRALDPIGAKLPGDMRIGHESIAYADEKIGAAYDSLLSKMTGKLDNQFSQDLSNITTVGQGFPADKQAQLQRIIKQEVLDRFTSSGLAPGETVKDVVSKLGTLAKGMRISKDYDERNMGAAIGEVQRSVKSMLERANPDQAGALAKIDNAYSQFLRVSDAAAKVGAKEGVFTPGQLRSSTKALDPSMRKKAFAKGQAPGQEFAEQGQAVLGDTVPDSGTPYRASVELLAGAGGAGYAFGTPYALPAAALGMAPYLPGGRQVAQWALASPKFGAASKSISEGVRKAVPYTLGGFPPLIEPPQQ